MLINILTIILIGINNNNDNNNSKYLNILKHIFDSFCHFSQALHFFSLQSFTLTFTLPEISIITPIP